MFKTCRRYRTQMEGISSTATSHYLSLKLLTDAGLIFLHCDGYIDHKQTDCRTYDDGRKLTYANRYSIREESPKETFFTI